jgi:uncharacterized protein
MIHHPKNILANPKCDCNMILHQVRPALSPYPDALRPMRHKMERFKLLLFVALLVAFPGLTYAGYDDGKAVYDKGDYAKAYKEFKPLAEQGDAGAQTYLGDIFEHGRGVLRDCKEAVKWYRKAAEQGNVAGQLFLGVCYETGQGVPQDYVQAVKLYRKAADQALTYAKFKLGYMYAYGRGIPKDYAEAVKWLNLAADQGNAGAQSLLGVLYADGHGFPQDYVQAYMRLNLAAAQDERDSELRDDVAKKMTPSQIAEAQRLATEWKPKGRE